jgi:hypothetical protein
LKITTTITKNTLQNRVYLLKFLGEFSMKTLEKPRFRNLSQGECAGAPILRTLWDRFDFSFLLTQSGIFKVRGVPTWIVAFMYVIGLIAQCTSVLHMSKLAQKDALLKPMFQQWNLAQHTLSRFLTTTFDWSLFGHKRVSRLQQDLDTALQSGDVIDLDDSVIDHPFGKKLPFLCWLYDSSQKISVWGMNLVVLHAVLRNGLEYPLYYKVWRKPAMKGEGPTKFDLAKEMLTALRQSTTCRLWVAMDRWYLCKDFFTFLSSNQFDWVTKAKRNTALYKREIHPLTGRERYVPVTPAMLIKEVFPSLNRLGTIGLAGIAVPDIYMKMPYMITNRKGEAKKKYRYTAIAAVVAMRLKEDEEPEQDCPEESDEDKPATYRGAYVLISNRVDAPNEVLPVYAKRWRIEVFFRRAKQDLGLAKCHSTTEEHHHAHLELLFAADTLVGFAHWEMNKEKTSDDEGCTHGEMVRCLFHTRCQIRSKTRRGIQTISLDIDIEAVYFARLIHLFWPKEVRMLWGEAVFSQFLPSSA